MSDERRERRYRTMMIPVTQLVSGDTVFCQQKLKGNFIAKEVKSVQGIFFDALQGDVYEITFRDGTTVLAGASREIVVAWKATPAEHFMEDLAKL